MTHLDFQTDLLCEVEELLKDTVSKNTAGEQVEQPGEKHGNTPLSYGFRAGKSPVQHMRPFGRPCQYKKR